MAERDSHVVGCIGYTPASDPRGIELKKLYVSASERKSGLGGRLVALVEEAARQRGAELIDLWSDTRFTTAHAFYEKRGWKRSPNTRELHDLSDRGVLLRERDLHSVMVFQNRSLTCL